MLDVDDEPGELPLMRNLHTLKQSKTLQDSPISKTLPAKSPVLKSTSSVAQAEANMLHFDSLEALHDNRDVTKKHGTAPRGSSGNITRYESHGNDGRRHVHRGNLGSKGRHKSLQMNAHDGRTASPYMIDLDSRMSWDLQRESHSIMDTGLSDPNLWKNSKGHNHAIEEIHGHDRRTMDWVNSSSMEENLNEPVQDMWNWPDFEDPRVSHNHPGFLEKDGRLARVIQKSKLEQGHKQWRQNEQILSPLILNPHIDMHRSPHAQSLFALEDGEIDPNLVEDWQHEMAYHREPYSVKVGTARSCSLLTPRETRRSHRKHATGMVDVSRSPQILNRHQYIADYPGPAPSESEFFEYEVEALELPSKKESGKSQQGSKHLNQGKGNLYNEERIGSHIIESVKGSRRKSDAGVGHQAMLPRRSPHPDRSPEVEPLPLLTELEDYNGSDEFGGTSIDGDRGELSMRELHGELELVACHNASDGNNGGRLVKVPDADGLQLSVQECKELALCEYKARNLSQKYRPKMFEELVGQHIVAQALSNAILKGKIAPVYLFQGPRGTGKTSAARIFASALICISSEGKRPCGVCRECTSMASWKCPEVKEVDAASNNGVERVKALLEETISAPPLSRYKVFIVDECHVLTTETWNALLRILEEPPMNVVFILITTDADQLPRTVVSRCQKFPFPKIKDSEIVKRLEKLAELEDLAIDKDTLQLIASRSDGSLRDAETILDQVSLLGQHINSSTVYELVGSVSDERLLCLLDSALLADTVSTVRRARELVDSGVEPLSLMSRLATLITDILAGSFKMTEKQRKGFFRKQSLSEEKLERLRIAMKILSEAEKQLRTSNDRTTWLIAALLQLGPDRSFMFPASCVGTSVTQSPVALDDGGENDATDFEHRSLGRRAWTEVDGNICQNLTSEFLSLDNKGGPSAQEKVRRMKEIFPQDMSARKAVPDRSLMQHEASSEPSGGSEKPHLQVDPLDECSTSTSEQRLSPSKLNDIWCKVVERCQSNLLRQLLYASVKLISISISEVDAVVHLEVCNPDDNASCSRSQKRIANLFEMVLGFPVEIRMSLASLPADVEVAKHSEGVPENHHRISSQSRSELDNRGNEMKPEESFPATPHGAHAWKKDMSGGHQAATNVATPGESREARRFSTSGAPMPADGGRGRHNDLHGEVTGYYGDIKDPLSEGERDLEEGDMLSPEFNQEEDPDTKAWPRHSAYEGPAVIRSYAVADGRRSCDADLQKRKGSHLNMVRRLSMRSRIRSLPSSDPNSPDSLNAADQRGSKKNTNSTNPQKGKEEMDGSEIVGESEEGAAANQKKGKLKGAAGGFARFFQGKLTKQGTDN